MDSDEEVLQGSKYQHGDGVEQDKNKAVGLFRLASDRGNPEAR